MPYYQHRIYQKIVFNAEECDAAEVNNTTMFEAEHMFFFKRSIHVELTFLVPGR